MKTAKQKFKSKIRDLINKSTSEGKHETAMQLYQTYFLFKKSLWKKINKKVLTNGHAESLGIQKTVTYTLITKKSKN